MTSRVPSATSRTARPIVLVTALALLAATVGVVQAEPQRCRREIARASAKLVQARLKAQQKCEDAVLKGSIPGPCPDTKATNAIAKATAKLRGALDKRCGGPDRSCGVGGDDEPLAGIGWDIGNCPNFENGACNNALANCTDVGDCVTCIAAAAVDQAVDLYYDDLAATSDRTIKSCQQTIGREIAKYFSLRGKILLKCEDAVLSGRITGPCPDPASTSKISTAAAKARAKICTKCGGADRTCGSPDDLTVAEIGFQATCPAVTVPAGTACGQAIANALDIAECVECVTNFKSQCLDAAAVPAIVTYPAECNGGVSMPTQTPTPTSTPGGGGQTATPTKTATKTPTPTPTATAGPNCGNNVVNAGEDCDGTADGACPGQCTAACTCPPPGCQLPSPLPEVVSFLARAGSELDTGWTGISHDTTTITDAIQSTARLSNCNTNLASPTCGQCDLDGPVLYPGSGGYCGCYNPGAVDNSTFTRCDPETPSTCSGPEICQCFYGPPLPISAGAVPVCVVNKYNGDMSGTANVADVGPHAGEGAVTVQLASVVHTGVAVDRPCPTCEGDAAANDGQFDGTCNGGARDGQPCDSGGTHEFFGTLALDCPPLSGASIGTLAITFDPATTGAVSLATALPCTAPGHTASQCFCDTCATANAEPCNSNVDCPGGAVCGGKRCINGPSKGMACNANADCGANNFCGRPGLPTAPNGCQDAVCSPIPDDGPHEGVCNGGPSYSRCTIETFRGCADDTDCTPPPAGTCNSCITGQTCESVLLECFQNPIVREGTPGVNNATVVATFCIPPTASSSVNSVSGLPGPGALSLPTRNVKSGAQCGNGVINGTEQCDPPADAACPGLCEGDCTCPICGDDAVNQPTEQCDGSDDLNCPGACQANCTCGGGTCGNGILEFGEDCDGAATGECVGACAGNCTCAPVCGDDVVNAGEQCDGDGSVACPPAACLGNCQCGPYCGNEVIDAGEQCDGPTHLGSCPGSCEADCTCSPVCGDDIRQEGELCDGTADSLCPGQCTSICTCPGQGEVTFEVIPGADLDTGWTGIAHDAAVQTGSRIRFELSGCDGADVNCDLFGNVGSFCSGDPSRSCTADNQCTDAGSCIIQTYGAPLPLSAGGVPACVVNRFATDATGTFNRATGSASLNVTLSSLVHLGLSVNEPCPICDCGEADLADCELGDAGTCAGIIGSPPCIVEGQGPLGPTSNDCPPSSSLNVSGGGLIIPFTPLSTGLLSVPSTQPCDGSGFTGFGCHCDGQPQPSACLFACDGGSNDAGSCDSDAQCPGGGPGSCKPLCRQIAGQPLGEGECIAGPTDSTCSGAPQVGCTNNSDCPTGTGTCVSNNRRCFMDPIQKQGTPGLTQNESVSIFCIPATTGTAINQTAGLPGPGAVVLPNSVDVRRCGDGVVNRPGEECDGASDSNCPGACLPNCSCNATCGNNVIEFGEQCDGTSDAACDGACGAPGTGNAECKCPPVCGDGFVGPGEECDTGGPGGSPPANDSQCPGQCAAGSCQCPLPPLPTCFNSILDEGEVCEFPAIGCGPLQVCAACTQCLPPPDVIPPELGFICGNTVVEPTESCEIVSIGCPVGQICNPTNCDECIPVTNNPICGNLSIESPEVCELPAIGCEDGEACLLCNQCIPFVPVCGNLNLEPGENCELPARGCGPLQVCLLCQQCVP